MSSTAPAHHDPDALALLYVQQWLQEHGHAEALAALEKHTGMVYDDSKLERSSCLMQLVWRHAEDQLLESSPEAGSEKALIEQEDEAMLRGGKGDFPQTVTHTITGVHPSSVVCVRVVPREPHVITGAGDGVLRRVTFEGEVVWSAAVGSGGVLAIDLQPSTASRDDATPAAPPATQHPPQPQPPEGSGAGAAWCGLVAAGSMDGSVSLVDGASGAVLASERVHTKYVVRVAWAGDGRHVVSCSHDQSVGVHVVHVEGAAEGHVQGSSAPEQQQGRGVQGARLITVRKVEYLTAVQDVAFLRDGVTLVVALRDTNYLRVLSLATDAEQRVNLNAHGDDHVSFFARHLVPSPCGRFLLACTDSGLMLLLRTRNWQLCRYALFTLPTEQFHQFCAAWSRDSFYIMAGAAGAQVWVYHVGSGKVVAKLGGLHKVNIRDLDYDEERHLLATGSFDKTVCVLEWKANH